MDRSTAQALIGQYLRICDELNQMTSTVGALPDSEEQKRLRRPIGEVHGKLYVELVVPIIKQYPALDPDKQANTHA